MENNENGNTTVQNIWDSAKAVLRGKITVIYVCMCTLRNKQTQINKLNLYLKELVKEQSPKLEKRR